MRVLVLASGSGTLFQALIDQREQLGIELVGLVADSHVPACDRAEAAGVPVTIVDLGDDRSAWDVKLREAITSRTPDLIVSAGFMRVIGPATLAAFEGRIINTHPALLPQFPGAHAVRDALEAHVEITGSTIHFVDAGVDTGEIIEQREVAVLDSDNESTLHERIKVVERELLVETVGKFARGELKVRS